MERLTEKNDEHYIARQDRVNGKIIGNQMCLDKLGELEDAEEQGLLRSFPVSVGGERRCGMIKKFLEEHTQFKLSIQHIGMFNGGFKVQLYNTTWDYTCTEPVYEHFISDFEIANLRVDFETAIMTPIINWWEAR